MSATVTSDRMTPLQKRMRLIDALRGPTAPRFLTAAALARVASASAGVWPPPEVSPLTTQRLANEMVDAGYLVRVQRNLYVNKLADPTPQPAEAAAHLRRGSVVSLQSVLGDLGIINNPPRVVFAVLPIVETSMPGAKRHLYSPFGEFRFYGMREQVFKAGSVADRLDLNHTYPRATPERALCDWIYLAGTPRSGLALPPYDVDLNSLSTDRLERLADEMGIRRAYEAWAEEKRAAERDLDFETQSSSVLGF